MSVALERVRRVHAEEAAKDRLILELRNELGRMRFELQAARTVIQEFLLERELKAEMQRRAAAVEGQEA